jgi:hypothetical protein
VIVKPQLVSCKTTPKQAYQAQIIDNGEFITLLLGHHTDPQFLNDIFGVTSISELRQAQVLPSFVPVESERADLL